MANLNLSEFTEKTFVADADWTFVWDTAGAISKKVSRNSLLNSGTLATSAPVTISQTWNAGAVAFTALKVNATSTNSASGSLLLDLQLGGVSAFNINKGGAVFSYAGANGIGYAIKLGTQLSGIGIGSASNSLLFWSGNSNPSFSNANLCLRNDNIHLRHSGKLVFGQVDFGWGAEDTVLVRDDAANTLALRNGTNAQTFRVYNTYTDASNYERGIFGWSANLLRIGTDKLGSGVARDIEFAIGGVGTWRIDSSGHFLTVGDNFDIGKSSGQRPRNVYVQANVISRPSASITPSLNSELVVEATSNTALTFKLKGTDGTVRSAILVLA